MSHSPPYRNHRPNDRTMLWIALGLAALFLAGGIGWMARSMVADSRDSDSATAKVDPTNSSQPPVNSPSNATDQPAVSFGEDNPPGKVPLKTAGGGSTTPITNGAGSSRPFPASGGNQLNKPAKSRSQEKATSKVNAGPPKLTGLPSFQKDRPQKNGTGKRDTPSPTKNRFPKKNKTIDSSQGSIPTLPTAPVGNQPKSEAATPIPSPPSGMKNQYALPQSTSEMTIFQELIVQRKPSFAMEGLTELKQFLKYRAVSQLTIGRDEGRGFRKVIQKIVDAKLLDADSVSAKQFEKSVKELIGRQFTFTLDRKQKILDFKGDKDKVKTFDLKDLSALEGFTGEGLMMSSVMDFDGWREMAQLTFLLPDDSKKKWTDQMSHDWGEMGQWSGETQFEKKGTTNQLLRIDYAHWMNYLPGDLAKSKLPFKLEKVAFEVTEAGGRLLFDAKKGRIHSLEERFQVNGKIDASLLGTTTKISLSEVQSFQLKLHDQNPQ